VEDLITVLLWSLENPETVNQTYEIGGSEYFSVRQAIEIIMDVHQARRRLVPLSPVLLRALAVTLESFVPNFPVSSFWLDYAAISRTCPVDNLPRLFGLMPARFSYRLDYLKRNLWYVTAWRAIRAQVGEAVDKILESVRTMRLP